MIQVHPDHVAPIEAYLQGVEAQRLLALRTLMSTIETHLPEGFEGQFQYKMIGYVVPKTLYPAGYHCAPEEPLPFLHVANQKNFIALYHMGIYMDNSLLQWFQEAYANLNIGKLDMGKSCIRFKKVDKIPYELIGQLCEKMTPDMYIARYESLRPGAAK